MDRTCSLKTLLCITAPDFRAGWLLDYWGRGTEVTVQSDGPSKAPTLFVFSPLRGHDFPLKTAEQLGPEVCLVSNIHPKGGDVVLNQRGAPVTKSTDATVYSTRTRTYYSAVFSNRTIHSCEMNGTFSNNEADDACGNIYPEKAKLNFYLLVMNGVRVVFTKVLAFSTILTIRACLF